MLLQPARQREASAREHFLEAASGPTSDMGSLHICSAHIGKIVIAVALDLEPNGSGGMLFCSSRMLTTRHPPRYINRTPRRARASSPRDSTPPPTSHAIDRRMPKIRLKNQLLNL